MSAKQANTRNVKPKRRAGLQVSHGIAYVHASFNNTIITITDPAGRPIAWSSAGKAGYSGSRKSSAFAATIAAQDVGKIASSLGIRDIEIKMKGPGAGRESAVRGLQSTGLNVLTIEDVTPVPHNGCRPPKRRRV